MACKCYHAERNFNGKIGVCWGTKEREACSCGGDESKCDFYEDKRKKATPKTTTADRIHSIDAMEKVEIERSRQIELWGDETHDPFEWLAILGEEYGELCQAINETYLLGQRYPERGGAGNIVKEAAHVAAVAVAIIEAFGKEGE